MSCYECWHRLLSQICDEICINYFKMINISTYYLFAFLRELLPVTRTLCTISNVILISSVTYIQTKRKKWMPRTSTYSSLKFEISNLILVLSLIISSFLRVVQRWWRFLFLPTKRRNISTSSWPWTRPQSMIFGCSSRVAIFGRGDPRRN